MQPRPTGKVTYDNSGRVVLVSGGASGIGWAVCQLFAQSGARVVCMDISSPSLTTNPTTNPTAIPTGADANLDYFAGDTSREADCQAAVAHTVAKWGGLDVLVNNAAIQPPSSYVPVAEVSDALWQQMLGVNLSGYLYLAKHALRCMLPQGSGVIVNMASGQAHRTARQVGCYGPLKAANVMQSMQWGIEYARHGIRVVSVSPGAINTPLVRASLEAQGGGEELANRHPLGRIGDPEEVAAAVVWLASSAASFITATDLAVDGGLGAFGAFADPYPKTGHESA